MAFSSLRTLLDRKRERRSQALPIAPRSADTFPARNLPISEGPDPVLVPSTHAGRATATVVSRPPLSQEAETIDTHVEEYLCSRLERQQRQHAEKFASFLAGIAETHEQREREVEQLQERTRASFGDAQGRRYKEWLELRDKMEHPEQQALDELTRQAYALCSKHDKLAARGLDACVKLMYNTLSAERALCERLITRVEAHGFQFKQARQTSKPDSVFIAKTIIRIEQQLMKEYVCPPPTHQLSDQFTDSHSPAGDESLEPSKRRPSVVSPAPVSRTASSDSDFDSPTSPSMWRNIPVPALLQRFEDHFLSLEDRRKTRWRNFQNAADNMQEAWWHRIDRLSAALAVAFESSLVEFGRDDGRMRGADETARRSICARVRIAEAARIREMESTWSRMAAEFDRQRRDFLVRLDLANGGLGLKSDRPTVLDGPLTPQTAAAKPHKSQLSNSNYVNSSAGAAFSWGAHDADAPNTRVFDLPFSPQNLFAAPNPSRPRPAAPDSVQTRRLFQEAEHTRDQRFEASLAAFTAESRGAERNRDTRFSRAVLKWEHRATRAERERTAAFDIRMEALRRQWNANRTKRTRDADQLLFDLDEQFGRIQTEREETFIRAVGMRYRDFLRAVEVFNGDGAS